jgi:hypothetical protein
VSLACDTATEFHASIVWLLLLLPLLVLQFMHRAQAAALHCADCCCTIVSVLISMCLADAPMLCVLCGWRVQACPVAVA